MSIFSAIGGAWERRVQRRGIARWSKASDRIQTTSLARLRRLTSMARQMQERLETFLHGAEDRLARPRIGSENFYRPLDADWSWRPEAFRGPLAAASQADVKTRSKIGSELTIFHDCPLNEIAVRHLRNSREEDLAPFGLRLEVFRFEGSFLSMVLDLPPEAVNGITQRHLVRMDALIDCEVPATIYARLNLQHGPNCEQILLSIDLSNDKVCVEFDLAYITFNEKRADKMWIDLILEGARMNQITLRDLTFSRTYRSDL